ncbi:MAG: hypothetical protein ACOYXY_05185, partial [Thermodesulfobacteriota bacterium]
GTSSNRGPGIHEDGSRVGIYSGVRPTAMSLPVTPANCHDLSVTTEHEDGPMRLVPRTCSTPRGTPACTDELRTSVAPGKSRLVY